LGHLKSESALPLPNSQTGKIMEEGAFGNPGFNLIGFNVPLNHAELVELEEEAQFTNQTDQNPEAIPNPMQGMEPLERQQHLSATYRITVHSRQIEQSL